MLVCCYVGIRYFVITGISRCREILVLAEIVHHFAIHGVHALTRDVALQVMTAINDGEPVSLCILEHAHHLGRGRGITEDGSGLDHQL